METIMVVNSQPFWGEMDHIAIKRHHFLYKKPTVINYKKDFQS